MNASSNTPLYKARFATIDKFTLRVNLPIAPKTLDPTETLLSKPNLKTQSGA